MHMKALVLGSLAALTLSLASQAAHADGDLQAGARLFQACGACHALAPHEQRTGPSLAGLWGRKAGTVESFHRYSPALESSGVTWNAETLDPWLADPQRFIPGNRMTFRGMDDAQARADLIAYLQSATAEDAPAQPAERGGMMAAPQLTDLRREVGPNNRITSIRHCGDTYTVAVETGEAWPFWEFNLRFKTDSSDKGPQPRQPVLLPASMMGDRAFVIFAAPQEISAFIESRC
jgi:cytochrome c